MFRCMHTSLWIYFNSLQPFIIYHSNRCQHLMCMLTDYANHLNVIGVARDYDTTTRSSNHGLIFLFMLIDVNVLNKYNGMNEVSKAKYFITLIIAKIKEKDCIFSYQNNVNTTSLI